MRKFISRTICAGIFLLGLSIGTANAVVLSPGYNTLMGTTSAAEPNLAGTVIVDDMVGFSFNAYDGIVSGTVQVRIVEAIDNTLDFYWRVLNDANSAGSIGSFRIGEFFTSVYNADYRTDGVGDLAPDSAYLFDGPFQGFVNVSFANGGLQAGQSSNFFFLDTDATAYAKTGIYDLTNLSQSQISSTYAMYAPAYDVPEPAGLILLGLGLLGLAFNRNSGRM